MGSSTSFDPNNEESSSSKDSAGQVAGMNDALIKIFKRHGHCLELPGH